MAGQALADTQRIERRAMRTLLKQLRLAAMACAANVRHGSHARRGGAMVAMATVARRRGKIMPAHEGIGVNARAILLQLICRYGVRPHVFGIGVTEAASFRNLCRINRTAGIFDL